MDHSLNNKNYKEESSMVANNLYNNNMVVHSKDSAAISILLLLKVLMDIDYQDILYKKNIHKY